MDKLLGYATYHGDELLALLGALWTMVSIVVRLTPSKEDDAWLQRIARRLSFLAPQDTGRTFSAPLADPCREKNDLGGGAALLLFVGAAIVLSACGAQSKPRTLKALSGVASTVVAFDSYIGYEFVRRRGRVCDKEATDFESWKKCMAKAFRVRDAVMAAAASIRAMEAAIHAAEGDEWKERMPCVSAAVSELVNAIEAVHIPVGKDLRAARDLLSAYGGLCHG